jgi:hypothetical protein
MPDDRDDWRWIDEHIEHPTPEIATDAVLAQGGEDGASQEEDSASQEEEGRPVSESPDKDE